MDADGRGYEARALDFWNRAYDQEEESRAYFAAKLVDLARQVGELGPLSLQELLQTGCEIVLERCRGQHHFGDHVDGEKMPGTEREYELDGWSYTVSCVTSDDGGGYEAVVKVFVRRGQLARSMAPNSKPP